jgi:uncharacterized membrane protein YfcA
VDALTVISLGALILAATLLYASVGHAGASGYLTVMALFGVAPQVMRPTALALNILVAAIVFAKFYRAKCFSWSTFWPFAVGAVPFAFIGGSLTLPNSIYKIVVGLVLLYAAFRLFQTTLQQQKVIKPAPLGIAIVTGVGIGLLSGLTGVGGGIFLSPLLLLMGWAETRITSGVSAAFILVNSVAGLLGHYSSVSILPASIPVWAAAAGVGGWVGAEYGSRKFSSSTLRRLLSAVLVIAGFKLIFS